jgi:hypothetical protein
MKYFKIIEFTESETAKAKGISNNCEDWQIGNVVEMVDELLDPLREAWGIYCKENNLGSAALRVTSGIRSKKLNEAVGGSKTSSHYLGYAADLKPYNGKMSEFKKFCLLWLKNKSFDQFISENETNNVPQWIHIGYKRYDGSQRNQYLKSLKGVSNKYYPL